MQPCPVCGSLGVDASGYCVQCRAYRGTRSAPPGATTAPLGTPNAPISVPPGYPAPGYPQPQPPQRNRSPLLVPLIALSSILVILVAAIVVVAVVRASGKDSANGQPTGAPTATKAAALVDECVVGTWRMSHYEEDVPVAGFGTVRFTGEGAEVRLKDDGTGVTDYKDGTTFNATLGGVVYKLVVTGTVSFGYRTNNGAVSFTGVTASGKETLTRSDTGQQVSQDLTGNSDPASYTCSGDSLTEFTNQYRAEMRRVSRTG
jgi:hypothetical protein